jgi:hypothetical protein
MSRKEKSIGILLGWAIWHFTMSQALKTKQQRRANINDWVGPCKKCQTIDTTAPGWNEKMRSPAAMMLVLLIRSNYMKHCYLLSHKQIHRETVGGFLLCVKQFF